jgi:hypothetical protein
MAGEFEALIEGECSVEYDLYLEDRNIFHKKDCSSCVISPVARCLYNKVPELGANERHGRYLLSNASADSSTFPPGR